MFLVGAQGDDPGRAARMGQVELLQPRPVRVHPAGMRSPASVNLVDRPVGGERGVGRPAAGMCRQDDLAHLAVGLEALLGGAQPALSERSAAPRRQREAQGQSASARPDGSCHSLSFPRSSWRQGTFSALSGTQQQAESVQISLAESKLFASYGENWSGR